MPGVALPAQDLNGGWDFTEIQAAIDAAEDGDTVLVKPGEYAPRASLRRHFGLFGKE